MEEQVPKLDNIVIRASWTFAALATFSFGLRLWCRLYRVGSLWWDDLVLGISVLVIILGAVFVTAMFHAGWSLNPVPHGIPVVWFLAAGSCGAVAAGLTKTAYVVTLLRLTNEVWTQRLLWISIASRNLVLWLGAISGWARICEEGPTWMLGTASTGGRYLPGSCWPERHVVRITFMSSVYSGVMDITLALCPWAVVRNLHMHKRHKIGISTSMSLGARAIGPLVMTIQSFMEKVPKDNPAYSLALRSILILGGPSVTVFAQVIPVLRAIFAKYDLKRT
ncbi:hypothetical protein PG996_015038 [Apiospora saccharicola]|uniref:Rhodopsin domain-containing protein n=1 Tax=Apiospora saccharicola TaxID=335842 RepID=A0ABR1TK20_9PEZI